MATEPDETIEIPDEIIEIPPAPGTIIKAYDYGTCVLLIVVNTDSTEEFPYGLVPGDHVGDSDAWRAELERALAAGEIVLEPPPPEPEPEPHQ